MVREVHHSVFVGRRGVVDAKFIVIGERVGHRYLKIPGVTFLTILAEIRHSHRWTRRCIYFLCRPEYVVETLDPAVQMILAVIDREFVLDAVKREASFSDAVSETSNRGAEARMRIEVLPKIVEAKDHVGKPTASIRHSDGSDGPAEVGDLDFHA